MNIDHVAIYVSDLVAEINFFIKYFGAKSNDGYHNPAKKFRSYFLTFDDGSRLEVMNREDITEHAGIRLGFHHIALNVGDKQAVDDLTANMAHDGIPVISAPRTTGDGYYESVVLDPEGNSIELVSSKLF